MKKYLEYGYAILIMPVVLLLGLGYVVVVTLDWIVSRITREMPM